MISEHALGPWIYDLRRRLASGVLADLAPFDLGDGTAILPGGRTVRIMLADLADLDDPAGSAAGDPAWRRERLSSLLDDFRRLRELIGRRLSAGW